MSFASAASWSSLPADLLNLIFALLPSRDLLAAARVCRTWRRHSISDFVWAPRLAKRLADDTLTLLELRSERSLSHLGLRALYIIYDAIGPKAYAYTGRKRSWSHERTQVRHIRDAAQLGFDPLRHTGPGVVNTLRLLRLLVWRGTRGVTAVAATCMGPVKGEENDAFPNASLTSTRRGRAFRTQFLHMIGLLMALAAASLAALYALCSPFMPRWLSFNAFIVLPLCLSMHFLPPPTLRALFNVSAARLALLLGPTAFNIYLMHRWDRPLWSPAACLCRAGIASLVCVCEPYVSDPRVRPTRLALAVFSAYFAVCDYMLPVFVGATVFLWWKLPTALKSVCWPQV